MKKPASGGVRAFEKQLKTGLSGRFSLFFDKGLFDVEGLSCKFSVLCSHQEAVKAAFEINCAESFCRNAKLVRLAEAIGS